MSTPPSSDQPKGRRFSDRFEVTRVLKPGATGQTLQGVDRNSGAEVVIRTVAGDDSAPVRARLAEEMASFDRLEGTALVHPIAVGRQEGAFSFVVPYVPGVTLEERLGSERPLGVVEALAVGRRVLAALVEAHEHGFLHGDVRPSNVVLGVCGDRIEQATLVDLCVARLRRLAGAATESCLRTARYASPEAAGLVDNEVDERSDLYSAGAVLFECLAGRPLFGTATVGEVLRQHLNEAVPHLSGLGVVLPGPLDEVVQRLLMKEPANRYGSARAALADLDQIGYALASGQGASEVVVGAFDPRTIVASPARTGRKPGIAAAEVTLSLLDRFDSLLIVGRHIASAMTPAAVYAAVREAALALLRAEDCLVIGIDAGHPLPTDVEPGATSKPYPQQLATRALVAGQTVVEEMPSGEEGSGGPSKGGVRSALCAPIFTRGRAVAFVYLASAHVGALFGEEEIRLADFITMLAGTALENAEGFAEVQALSRSLEKRVDERTTELAHANDRLADTNQRLTERSEAVALLKTIAVAANEAGSVEAALQVGLDEVCRHTGWPVGHVCRVSARPSGDTVPSDIWHLDDPDRYAALKRVTESTPMPLGAGLPGRVTKTREPVWIEDVTGDETFLRAGGPAASRAAGPLGPPAIGVRAGIAVPLLAGQEVLGVLEFFSPDALPLDQPLLDLVGQVGTELGRVAERKRAEDALRQSEERTRTILYAANDAFIGMDQDGLITDWNRSAEAIFGWSGPEVVGRSLSGTIIPPGLRQAHENGLQHFLTTGEGPVLGKRIELPALHRDGHDFAAELSIWATVADKRQSFNAFVQDITERKRTEQALAEARDQAMEASRMKSQFVATMSHEIRTPLNGVIGLAGLLADTELTGQQRPYVDGLRTAGETLLAVINDILDFSKIEAGKLVLEDVRFDTRQLVGEVLSLLGPSARAKGLSLVGGCSPDIPAVLRGDPVRLRQILVNLVSNAVKFTATGEVVVRVERVGELTAEGMTVRLAVSDTGIGIDPSDQAHILEPFSQADASTTRRFGGTGLGLAICRQLAEAMGGSITLSSEPGRGSTFRVAIALGHHQEAEAIWAPPTTGSADTATLHPRVLLVEDNAINQMVAGAILKKLGYQADVVSDGRQAVAAVTRHDYGVVLMDCHMPVMDGYEATQAIRAQERGNARVPIVAMTASALVEDRERCLDVGMDDYLSKPFTRADLKRVLAIWGATHGRASDLHAARAAAS